MKFIRVGKIVNTHGIKGELRLLSDFKYKNRVFVKNMKIYIGKKKNEYIINSYRFHKIFDMITLKGYTNINDVEFLKGEYVFINESDLKLEEGEFLSQNLIGYTMYIGNKEVGKISEVINTPANEVIKAGDILVPYVKDFINKIDEENKIIYINDVRGLI